MEYSSHPRLYIRFSLDEEVREASLTTEQIRQRFWYALVDVDPGAYTNREDYVSNNCERVSTDSFGRCLLKQLLEKQLPFLLQYSRNLTNREAITLIQSNSDKHPVFSFVEIQYGSATFTLSPEGIPFLASAFGGNIDLFLRVLEDHSYPALVESLQRIYEPRTSTRMSVQASANTSFQSEFRLHANQQGISRPGNMQFVNAEPLNYKSSQEVTTALPQQSAVLTPPPFEEYRRIWRISNYSLVPAVVLGFIVLYVAFAGVREERKILEERRVRLDKIEEQLILQSRIVVQPSPASSPAVKQVAP